MSDRGPADEDDGDTANSSLDPSPPPLYMHTHPPTQICLKTNNIFTVIGKHSKSQHFHWKNNNKSSTNASPSPTHKKSLLESFTCKCIFMGHTTEWKGLSRYRFQGARSLRCCHLEWFSHSDPRAGSGVRCGDQTTTCCWESPIPPSRCHSSCAERRPAGPAQGWWWRRSLVDGYAKKKRKKRDNNLTSSTQGNVFFNNTFSFFSEGFHIDTQQVVQYSRSCSSKIHQ